MRGKHPLIIDLATTQTECAVIRSGEPQLLELDGSLIVPSVWGFYPGKPPQIGRGVMNDLQSGKLPPDRVIQFAKRELGTDWSREIDGVRFRVVNLYVLLLNRLIEAAEEETGDRITGLCITHPAHYEDHHLAELREAIRLLGRGFNPDDPAQVILMKEPVAAIYHYGLRNQKVIIFDLGGGTLDVSLADCAETVREIVATVGNSHCGGKNIDLIILERLGFSKDDPAIERLFADVAVLKHRLTTEAEVQGTVGGRHVTINRAEFDQWLEPFCQLCLDSFEAALKAAEAKEYSRSSWQTICLVGGSTFVPLIIEALTGYCREQGMAAELKASPDRDLAVIKGAGAFVAGMRKPVQAVVTFDSTVCDYCVVTRAADNKTRLFQAIVPAHTMYPCSRTVTWPATSDGRHAVAIEVWATVLPHKTERQDGREYRRKLFVTRYEPSRARRIGVISFRLPKGEYEVEITLELDLNRTLSASAQVTGKPETRIDRVFEAEPMPRVEEVRRWAETVHPRQDAYLVGLQRNLLRLETMEKEVGVAVERIRGAGRLVPEDIATQFARIHAAKQSGQSDHIRRVRAEAERNLPKIVAFASGAEILPPRREVVKAGSPSPTVATAKGSGAPAKPLPATLAPDGGSDVPPAKTPKWAEDLALNAIAAGYRDRGAREAPDPVEFSGRLAQKFELNELGRPNGRDLKDRQRGVKSALGCSLDKALVLLTEAEKLCPVGRKVKKK